MQNVFSETLSFTISIKPEIERQIHMFSAGGGQTGEIQVFMDAFHEDVPSQPPFEDSRNLPLGMTVMVLKFPEWLANFEYQNTYEKFVGSLEKHGMQTDDSVLREVKTYTDLDRPSLIREAIKRLDITRELAEKQFEAKPKEKKKK